MNHRIPFFATKCDMIRLLNCFSEMFRFPIIYVKTGNFENNIIPIYHKIDSIPNLGLLSSDNHCSECYLIMKNNEMIVKNELTSSNKKHIYSIFASQNLNSIVFYPSGFDNNSTCLIHGQISLISTSSDSKDMFNVIKKCIRKQFTNVRGWYIGEEASQIYGKVRFVTISANEPIEYDFKI